MAGHGGALTVRPLFIGYQAYFSPARTMYS